MQEEKFLNVLKSRMVDGIIYVSSDYATSNKLYISKYLNPELTTVRQDAYEMGKQAAGMLIEHIEQKSPLKDIVLSHEIVERNTV